MMTAMATTTTITTAMRTTKGVNPMQATRPLLPITRVTDPTLFTILQARRARNSVRISPALVKMHTFFDWLKNSPPHPDIIPTTNPKNVCIFTRAGDTDETRDSYDADRAPASTGRIYDIFAEHKKLLSKR
jgi:hypothetical protein